MPIVPQSAIRNSKSAIFALLALLLASTAQAQAPARPQGRPAEKPAYRDPVFDGAADPAIAWNYADRKFYMFYTNRRANLPDDQIDGVNWVHGTKIGVASSIDGASWQYVGTANIDYGGPEATYWAPDIIYGEGGYHMFLTLVPGVFTDWNHPRSIIHLTSENLSDWKYQSTLQLASDRVIDPSVVRLAEGGYRMWYNNEVDKKSIYYADSDDLKEWHDKGKVELPDFPGGEGPKVFFWHDAYWMIVDVWNGLAVYRSADALSWKKQADNLLQEPGAGKDDGVKGQHADVVATLGRAYLYYFTHPGRVDEKSAAAPSGYERRRSSIQVVELKEHDGVLSCDRNEQTVVNLNMQFRARLQIHDPSTITRLNDRYWMFSTGLGVQSLASDDLKHWKLGPPVMPTPPAWVESVVPNQRGGYWAPDLTYRDGRYWLYYSVSAFGKRTSAIALATSPTLDPAAPGFEWTDRGIVIQTDESMDFNAIDPAPVTTPEGDQWLVFGSFWSGIKLIQLDPKTGKRIAPDSPMYSLAHKAEIEASAIKYHDGYYYLFVNWGTCCRGVRSTYNIRVGRSKAITGPYLDRDGVDMLKGGGSLVLESDGAQIGPGHAGFFQLDGREMISYHYYDANQRGLPQLGIRELGWDDDGWPKPAAAMEISGGIQPTQ